MSSPHESRLYTFVAGLYLSELQKGLQTAHVVSELSQFKRGSQQAAFNDWALQDKTIIICNAGNHKGVVDCWTELERINTALSLPAAIFYEDEQSMNKMATACGVIVPRKYWDVQFFQERTDTDFKLHPAYWEHGFEKDGQLLQRRYPLTHPEGQFCAHIKQYRLA